MSVAIIGVAGTVAAAGIGAYSSYASNKSADARQKAALAANGSRSFQPFTPPPMPAFIPANIKGVGNDAARADTAAYARSDADFGTRHPLLLSAEKAFEKQTAADQTGNTELMPEVQNEFMRAGLGNALGAFGDTSGTLAPGSSGEASVARNLGLKILDFQNMNRQNRQNSLQLAEGLFPRRQIGLTGADVTNLSLANLSGQNNWNQDEYGVQLQAAQNNYNAQQGFQNSQIQQGNVNAQAAATSRAANASAMSGIASSAINGLSGAAGAYFQSHPSTTAGTVAPMTAAAPSTTNGVANLSWRPTTIPTY